MNSARSLRLAAIAVAAIVAAPLSGCSSSDPATDSPQVEETTTAPAPQETSTDEAVDDEPAASGAGLSFAEGNDLAADTYIEWADGLLADDGWETVSADNGEGGWTYGTVDGACTAAFWQGYITDIETTPGDDSASSDAMLALILDADVSEFAQYIDDGGFSYQVPGNTLVAHRQVAGQQDGRTWLIAARAFVAVGVGTYVVIDCTSGDPFTILDEINAKNPIIAQ